MSTPPPPGYAPVARDVFVEPTRRLAFSQPFTYDGRYGASLTSMVLGGWLLLNANIAQLAIGLGGIATYGADQVAYFLIQYLFAIAAIVFGLAIAPAASGRRVIAVVVVLLLIVVWTLLYTARITGSAGPLPFASGFITAPSFIVPLVTATGWLIVRERPGLSYLFLVLSLLGGAIPFFLVLSAAPSIASQVIGYLVAGVVGVGIAWGARAVAGLVQVRHDRSSLVDEPPAV